MDVGTIVFIGVAALAMVAMHRAHGRGGGHGHGGGEGRGVHGAGGCGGGHGHDRREETEQPASRSDPAPPQAPKHEHGPSAPARDRSGR